MPAGHKLVRRLLAQRAVWSIVIVVPAPLFHYLPGRGQRHKLVLIQTLLPQSAVEAFDENVVGRQRAFNRFNEEWDRLCEIGVGDVRSL